MDSTRTRARKECNDKTSMRDQVRKEKDPKSFTQNLFNTFAMKLLQFSKIPYGYGQWAPWNEDYQLPHMSNQASNTADQELNQAKPGEVEKKPYKSLPLEIDSREMVFDLNKLQHNAVEADSASSDADLDIGSGREALPREKTSGHVSPTNEDCSKPFLAIPCTDRVIKTPSSISFTSSMLSQHTRFALGRLGASETKDSFTAEEAIVPLPFFFGPCQPPQSLSHLTSANILELLKMMVANHCDVYEQHGFLLSMGRIDHSSRALKLPPGEAFPYERYDMYIAQSMTFVLSSVEALLQSFLHFDHTNEASRVVWSYDFPLMVHSFRNLFSIECFPDKILESLWVSAGRLYVPSVVRFKNTAIRRSVSAKSSAICSLSLAPPLTPQDSLDDLEACHIIKVIFAALVAAVPRCKPKTWDVVRKLHASGKVGPFTNRNDPDIGENIIDRVLSAIHMFQDEAALDLIKRLVRAVAARYFLPESLRERVARVHDKQRQYDRAFIARILLYVNADRCRVVVADCEDRPSVKNGRWVDYVHRMTWDARDCWPVIIEWLRAVILKEWDGKPRVAKCSAVGGALEFLSYICERRVSALSLKSNAKFTTDDELDRLDLEEDTFHTPFLSERLDVMTMPPEWLRSKVENNSLHVLSYPFLFPPSALVTYFRSINHAAMYSAFQDSIANTLLAEGMTFTDRPSGRGALRLHDRLRVATNSYLVLEVRRGHVLMDAMNQLWRRQTRELKRPLKVRMGMQEGEEGIDHGGVQQEFFRVAFAEALNVDYGTPIEFPPSYSRSFAYLGAFTTDPVTHMSWFHPCSPEPLYKFELLGLLTSLAVYNGLTLPFTFPLVMYRKLLGITIHRLGDLEDGWPELVKGLRALRDWKDGAVEDVFMRSYVFSLDLFGSGTRDYDISPARMKYEEEKGEKVKIDDKTPGYRTNGGEIGSNLHEAVHAKERHDFPQDTGSPSKPLADPTSSTRKQSRANSTCSSGPPPTPMVTNENRHAYISDYIWNLTSKSIADQFNAFRYGFFTCFPPKAISLFDPFGLKALVEGLPDIPLSGLEEVTRYEGGYDALHPTIRHFWSVIRSWPQYKVRQLLEFVTASDRLPVGGVSRLSFTVQKNGAGDGRLPTSLTCFGRLLLPEYDSEEKLREGLEKAVENSKGFGQP